MNNRVKHPFEVGGQYRNRNGAYEVLDIDGERMTVRYEDGREQSVSIELQRQIWRNIRIDEAPPPAKKRKPGERDVQSIQPIIDLVETVIVTISSPYPADIIDQVCLAIEKSPDWSTNYQELVDHFSSQGKNGKQLVNTNIGFYTRDLAGMVKIEEGNEAKSGLIQTFSTLRYPEQKLQ